MPEPRPQVSRSQRMADVLPPKVSPNEGELPEVFLRPAPKKEAVAELKLARTPWIKFTPEIKRASRILSVLAVVLIVGFGVMRISFLQDQASQAIQSAQKVMRGGVSLASFPQFGSLVTEKSDQDIGSLNSPSVGSIFKRASITDLWGLFTRGGEALGNFQKTIDDYRSLTEDVALLSDRVPGIFLESGPGPLPVLQNIQKRIKSFEANNAELSASLSTMKGALPIDFSEYVAIGKSLNRISDVLDTGIRWLEKPHRIIVAFQNSSEMRPTGGFFGSYAEVTFEGGKITNIEVRDVTEADKEFSEFIVPPQPLQYITKNWRAADANWYFDFPRSASQTLSFLEKSDIYKSSSTTFDGFIAVSPRVLEDVIEVTGQIQLKDRKLLLTSANFLKLIQGDVVTERAQSSEAPKSILSDIVSILQDRLMNLSVDQRSQLTELSSDWVRYKDVQIFMRDPEVQGFARFFGADGSVAATSPTQNVDYLALIDSTIGGEKTNYVMDRTISFRAQIEEDGRVSHKLNITRAHRGNKETERWYTVPNRNYLRVLMPAGSQILGASGFEDRKPASRSYGEEYAKDSLLTTYESTFKTVLGIPSIRIFEESDKMGVAGWTVTEKGKETKVVLDYEYRLPEKPSTGVPYQFIFEKQAGTEGSYAFEIDAPVGYHFRENKLPIFEYKTEDIPARVVINLTLEKI